MLRTLMAMATGVLMSGSLLAQQPTPVPGSMPGMDAKGMDMMMVMPTADDTPSTKAFKMAMMHAIQTMPAFSGDADVDFMKQRRPHHQAAIEMAKIAVANPKDADVKKLAQEIISAQEKEIATIDAWLKKKG
jgi:uncharacterized protein (DUF305 family)